MVDMNISDEAVFVDFVRRIQAHSPRSTASERPGLPPRFLPVLQQNTEGGTQGPCMVYPVSSGFWLIGFSLEKVWVRR